MYRIMIACFLIMLMGACAKSMDAGQPAATTDTPAAAPEPSAAAAAQPAQPAGRLGAAPDFTLEDLDGNQVSLASFRGKTVVLEWFNPGCPFVKHAHGTGPLEDMARARTAEGVVWLSINSGGPGKQGHGVDANKKAAAEWAITNPILIDESGQVGKAYGAQKTPHMFVIDKDGQIGYRGALDNAPIGEPRDGDAVVSYFADALAAVVAGKSADPAETAPYGCSVKYAS